MTPVDFDEFRNAMRGAWLSVQRHFAEAGHDIDVDPFTVAGIEAAVGWW